jgi:hypothetical protein
MLLGVPASCTGAAALRCHLFLPLPLLLLLLLWLLRNIYVQSLLLVLLHEGIECSLTASTFTSLC